jgi:ABC-type transporter MlaC component
MKIKTLFTLFTSLVLAAHCTFAAEEPTELEKEMKAMNKALRTLKRQIADPTKKDANLELLTAIKKSVEASHKLEPAKTKSIPEAERKAYVEKYKEQVGALDKTFDKLAAAIKADKADEAKTLMDELGKLKEKGHKDFTDEEEK